MRLRCLLTAVGALVLATMGAATEYELGRFQLFNNCEPVDLLVEDLSFHATGIGLTERTIQNAVESRLRSARLYNSLPRFDDAYLYVNVHVLSRSFSIRLSYHKTVIDEASGLRNSASTWGRGITGAHGGNASFILSGVSELMDEFLVEYLRVNEEAC